MLRNFLLSLLFLGVMLCGSVLAASTEFTYQGQLRENNVPSNGNYDLTFALFDAATGGTQIGSTNSKSNQTITNGVFTKCSISATARLTETRVISKSTCAR